MSSRDKIPDEFSSEPIYLAAEEEAEGTRLDSYLAKQFPLYSRVQIRRVINAAGVKVDGARVKASLRLKAGQQIEITLPDLPREGPQPENIPLDVLYEDDHLAAINKPPGMVVHPSKGHWSGTLAAALAYRFNELSSSAGPTRPGIVHRLDRDTSGVIVVAKSDRSHAALAAQFEARTTEKEYFAIVLGSPNCDRDFINQPIGEHPYQREKKAIRSDHPTSRDASTFYEVTQRFKGFSALKILPKTGRTHQIRIHLTHIGNPVLCDRLYGGRSQITYGEIRGSDDESVLLSRQALHAMRLKLKHPITQEPIEFVAPPPPDLQQTLDELQQFRSI